MGRGRQKAKQTKVARDLKYFSPDSNFSALEKELRGEPTSGPTYTRADYDPKGIYDDDDYPDYELINKYAAFEDDDDEDETDEE